MDYPRKKSFSAELLEKRKKKNPTIIAIAVVAVIVAVIAVGYALYMRFGIKEIPVTEETIIRKPSIAVLSFRNMSSDEEQEYFCEGISEEIINALTNVEGLRVIARTSAFLFKDKQKDIAEIGRKLNVETVLEGSVRKAGNQLRITAQLINVADESHIWSDAYNRELEDVFAIQEEISLSIVEALKIKLLGKEKAAIVKRPTENVEAFILYSKGLFHWNKRTKEGLEIALDYFQQAIDKDPQYALAYSGMADTYNMMASYGYMNQTDGWSLAKEKAEKALEIDDMLAEAHTSLASVLTFGGIYRNRNAAEKEYRRALELNPGYATAHKWYAGLLQSMGQHSKALEEMRRALDLDPLLLIINADIIPYYGYLGRYDEAREQFNRAIELDPNFSNTYVKFGVVCMRQGKYEEAEELILEALELNPSGFVYESLGNLYTRQGKYKELEELMLEALGMYPSYTWFYLLLGEAYIQQGKYDKGIDAFKTAVEISGPGNYEVWAEGWLGHAYVLTGERDKAEKIIISLKERKEYVYTSLIWIAKIYMALGENDTAFEWLQKAFEEDDADLGDIEYLPEYDNFRSDPKCMALLKKMGLPED